VAAPTYYVDSVGGNDHGKGTSPEHAWQSLAKVNTTTFVPGSRILLKAGAVYQGCLRPRCSGQPGQPLVIDRWGDGAKPRLQGVILANVAQWEIHDLDLSGGSVGVLLQLKDFGVARHIHLVNLDIHDVRGNLRGDDSGILATNSGETTWFEDFVIEGCTIRNVDRNGILITDYPGPTDKHRNRQVVIRNNQLTNLGGDGIFILACRGAVIEHNTVRYAHQRVGRRPGERACAGIWPFRSEDTLIQFNEVSHTAVGGLTVWDSEAFDDDIGCHGTIFQYNYSHDNAGGFLLDCGGRGTIVRYNISQNDATATFTFESDNVGNVHIYNNTVYVSPKLKVELVRNTFGKPAGVRFTNNLFAIAGEARYAFGHMGDVVFEHNAFGGRHVKRPADTAAINGSPKLAAPGRGSNGFGSAVAYKLRPDSPCRGAGVTIDNCGGRDFWGIPVPPHAAPSVGACQD
jgi:hypothetical protein